MHLRNLVTGLVVRTFGQKQAEEEMPVASSPTQEEEDDLADNFEPIAPGAEVLVSVRGLQHTYQPGLFNCDKNKKPVEVLKGLDMDICRGEVFGYLGHNGAGSKSKFSVGFLLTFLF
jgi:ABC-type glutathione transport system ATPase component